ncbi:peroxide stress protein YaaA [Cecembia sp.]|uniref:peroxide stress protein YaaA n=1 Tax=Cecembia sp. TaxID=1898110 RepID=UPI0025C1348D|nr:peroxide stress protein YaaA [Cecembia sp.]
MITIISPSKTLDLSSTNVNIRTQPEFLSQTMELVAIMKEKSTDDLMKLMGVSEKLAALNEERYKNFKKSFGPENAKQALLAFKGDVYTKINVGNFNDEDYAFAQKHLRILSGLYGLLKPMDLIQPYRLEMGIRLENKKGKNLYEFWGQRIAKGINEVANGTPIINLASQEYFKAVDSEALKSEVITPVFKEFRNGKYKVIGLFAKQARGLMTDFVIKNRILEPEKLKTFNEAKYEFKEVKGNGEWVFVR